MVFTRILQICCNQSHSFSVVWCNWRTCGVKLLFLLAMIVVPILIPIAQAGLVDFSPGLLAWVEKRFGTPAIPRLMAWRRLLLKLGTPSRELLSETTFPHNSHDKTEVLMQINVYFNRVPYNTDQAIWGVPDYWATPIEFLGANAGDCEDYVIAKYLSLKEIGIPVDRLRIVYVRVLKYGVPHMVLAYYPTPDADPFILDNMMDDIRKASARNDLQPVFSFNEDDLWDTSSSQRYAGEGAQIRMWKGVVEKLEKELRM